MKTEAQPRDYADRTTVDHLVKTSDGREYAVHADGSWHRLTPQRPWRGKAERRRVIKARMKARKATF